MTQWQQTYPQRRFASGEASPTDAQTTGETVPSESTSQVSPAEEASPEETVQTEPSSEEQKQEIKEESISTPETADAAQSSGVAETISSAAQAIKQTASRVTERVRQNVPSVGDAGDAFNRGPRDRYSRDGRDSRAGLAPPVPSKILYIGNLFFEAKAENLESEFEKFGTVVNSKIATDANGLSKGYDEIEGCQEDC